MTAPAFQIVGGADLSFDAESHEYHLPNGRRVPSVTEILKATGVAVDFDALGGMSRRLTAQIEDKRQLGTAVHADAHAYDDRDLEWDTVSPLVLPYLRAWATFRENTGLAPMTRERIVYHAASGYCGTLDGVFVHPAGRLILVDIKIGDPVDSGCQYQTAAYQAAYLIDHPDQHIAERWGVQLTPERTVPYRISPYTDWRDFPAFQAFVATYQHQADRRRNTR